MLTHEEKKFLAWWEANKEKEKNIFHQLRVGLPVGLLIGVAILINFATGWYQRANMAAFSQSTPLVLIAAIIIIAVFCAVFFKRHKWEMNDKRYKILMQRREMENKQEDVQQEKALNSH